MRRAGLALALLSCLCVTGCFAGPKQMQRSVDDWDNKLYVQTPWMDGLLWVVGFFPVMHMLAFTGDTLMVNGIAFWFEDAWDCKGTGFRHLVVKPQDGEMRSMMMADSEVMKVYDR